MRTASDACDATFWRFDHLGEIRDAGRTIALDDTTLIGHAARIGEPVVVADAYHPPDGVGLEAGAKFDREHAGPWSSSVTSTACTFNV